MTRQNKNKLTTAHSLSRRAALAQMTIITVVVLCFSFAIISFNTYRLNSQTEEQLDSISRLAETSLASAVWQVDHASVHDFIKALLQDDSIVFAQVVTGREVMASETSPIYAGQPFKFFQNDSNFMTKTVEIKKFGDWIGTFDIAISSESIDREIFLSITSTLTLALVLIMAISQTTIYFARKRLFNPLKHLEESAMAIADGDLDAPIDTSAPDDLGNLARAFDDMRESVRHLIGDLQEANTKLQNHRNALETTVIERTEELNRKNTSLNLALEKVNKSKKAAEVANVAKSRFLASMSHEIRTPMNAILGMAEILCETELTEDQERYIQVFKTAGESLLEILNDILDLSKIEAGHLELEETGFSLGEIVDKTCAVIEPKAKQKKMLFESRVMPDIPDRLTGDPTRLRQILTNLLGNAVKFTSEGSVSLIIERAPGLTNGTTLQFSISDTGMGIPPDKLGSIFDAFTQADNSTTREFGGTGLGLAISKQLVQMMDGRIWAESSPGKGSTFRFTARFGVPQRRSPLPQENDSSFKDHPVLPMANILMFEDSKYNAFVIQTYLKGTPCNLTIAENGASGFELFKKGGWDIILMDIQMPVMDGYEATRAIRKWEREQGLPPLPIVAMTAYALVGDAEKCLEAGANMHLPKPVKKSSLFAAIKDMVDTISPHGSNEHVEASARLTQQAGLSSDDSRHDLRKMVLATYKALDKLDYVSIRAIGSDLADKGTEMSINALTDYGTSLKNAADDEADPGKIRQIINIITEYIDRFETV